MVAMNLPSGENVISPLLESTPAVFNGRGSSDVCHFQRKNRRLLGPVATAMDWPSGEMASEQLTSDENLYLRISVPDEISSIRRIPLLPSDTRSLPSGVKASAA